jgi:hypothetical protein
MGAGQRCGAALVCLIAAACGDDIVRTRVDPPDAAPITCRVPITHDSIQAALDDPSCPTVWIESGFYRENLVIERDVSLEAFGGTVAIDGAGAGRVMEIGGDARVTLVRLSMQNGFATEVGGGAIANVGTGTLEIRDSVVEESIVDGDLLCGGGIHSDGPLVLDHTLVRGNLVTGRRTSGGGVCARSDVTVRGASVIEHNALRTAHETQTFGAGGGLYCSGTGAATEPPAARIEGDSRIANNEVRTEAPLTAASGGGIDASGCRLSLVQADVTDNVVVTTSTGQAYAAGGAIAVSGNPVEIREARLTGNQVSADGEGDVTASGGAIATWAGADIWIESSALAGNRVTCTGVARGGALDVLLSGDTGTITLVNSTLAGNTADAVGGSGGAIHLKTENPDPDGDGGGARLALHNVTISGNQAESGGGMALDEGGFTMLEALVASSIVAGNQAGGAADVWCRGAPLGAAIVSSGYNLWGERGGCALTGQGDLDREGIDPGLGPLGDHGGRTPTRVPLAGSPAIDGGNPAGCVGPDGVLLETDQRGVPRPVGVCDSGAVEVQ